jgi:GPI-GlcNAc transferase complex, PIG-H component
MGEHRRFCVCIPSKNDPKVKIFLFSLLLLGCLNSSFTHEICRRLWRDHVNSPRLDSNQVVENVSRSISAVVLGGLLLYSLFGKSPKTASEPIAVVSVYPGLGVQLSHEVCDDKFTTTPQPGKNRLFIPRDKIVDCIVYEVILSHKVTNVLAFRVLTSLFSSETNEKDLKLVPAFPGTEMTYQECFYMRKQILQVLGLVG